MDYLLIAVIAFLASYFGSSLATKTDKQPVIPNPIKNVVNKIEQRKVDKADQVAANTIDSWLYPPEGDDDED